MAPHKKIPAPDPKPVYRMLKAYAFDPSRGKNYGNYMSSVRIPWRRVR